MVGPRQLLDIAKKEVEIERDIASKGRTSIKI
jgi:hypothetical protein